VDDDLHARRWLLAARPAGVPAEDDFRLVDVELDPPGAGEVLVRNEWVSVDPGTRSRMDEGRSYTAGMPLGSPITSRGVGRVVRSRHEQVPEGAVVHHFAGWCDGAVLPGDDVEVLDAAAAPAEAWLDELGVPGFTAWLAVAELGAVQPGETVYVSSAAGAVGSVAGQIARLRGADRVIGSAGAPAKVAWLTGELGFDAAFSHRAGPVGDALAQLAPDGLDVAVDTVGGATFEAAFGRLRMLGRLISVGTLSAYNAGPGADSVSLPAGRFVRDRLTVRGFTVFEYADRRPSFVEQMSAWLASGALRTTRTVFDGLEQVPAAFASLFDGSTRGKTLVRVGVPGA
jgi:NADPH-dependent curcumin reductase CurA